MLDRYTETYYVPRRRVLWSILAADLAAAAKNQFEQVKTAVQNRWSRTRQCATALGIAACIGVSVAIATYQQLTGG